MLLQSFKKVTRMLKNELFTKIHEDPMFMMKKEEIKQRKEIQENPYKMKMLMKEIEKSMTSKNDERKKQKREETQKRQKAQKPFKF